ncbi:hypothetical protein [Halorubrum sp. SD626R]|uniref:hypothetical protein n=1 Tax=Halorubrum sp. SD626R TaxID=1419722 RepID=UPI000A89873F|nr:hypothetical protein [Halorubrum sp. SD626R]
MPELFVFTIFAAVVTLYSVLPKHRQLRTDFAISRRAKCAATIGGFSIILLYLSELYLETASLSFSWGCSLICLPAQFWVGSSQVLIATSLAGYTCYVFLQDEATIYDDEVLETRLRNLFATQQFNTLSALIEDNYSVFFSTNSSSQALRSRETATELLTAKSFLENHSELNPSLAAKIIGDPNCTLDRTVFAREYLKALHRDHMSLLYHEVEAIEGQHADRKVPESSLLLASLFGDSSIATELRIWDPIRESVKSYLRTLSEQPDDKYIGRSEDFPLTSPERPSHDPILVGIELFDLFASQALRQDIDSHIFLHFLAEIVEEICSNFELDSTADPTAEFPNAYAYLLKHAIAVYRSLVTLPTQQSRDFRMSILKVDTEVESDILKNAAWGFVRSQKAILLTNSVPDQFKSDVVNDLIQAYIELAQTNDRMGQAYYATLHKHILYGTGSSQTPSDEHLEFLRELDTQISQLNQANFSLGSRGNYYRRLSADIQSVLNNYP